MSAQYLDIYGDSVEIVLDDEDVVTVKLYESEDPVRDLLNLVNYTDEPSIFYAIRNQQANLWGFCSVPRSKTVTNVFIK